MLPLRDVGSAESRLAGEVTTLAGRDNVSQKILRYFPLKDRLKRFYASRHTSLEMQWHE
jgi:hypothetical protein